MKKKIPEDEIDDKQDEVLGTSSPHTAPAREIHGKHLKPSEERERDKIRNAYARNAKRPEHAEKLAVKRADVRDIKRYKTDTDSTNGIFYTTWLDVLEGYGDQLTLSIMADAAAEVSRVHGMSHVNCINPYIQRALREGELIYEGTKRNPVYRIPRK